MTNENERAAPKDQLCQRPSRNPDDHTRRPPLPEQCRVQANRVAAGAPSLEIVMAREGNHP